MLHAAVQDDGRIIVGGYRFNNNESNERGAVCWRCLVEKKRRCTSAKHHAARKIAAPPPPPPRRRSAQQQRRRRGVRIDAMMRR